MNDGSTDLVVRPEEQAVHGMEVAERIFTPERRQAIARFLNVVDDEPALLPYLATCASYGLDPIMGQIWLIPQRVKIRSRDGSGEQWGERLRPSVGRDGLLTVAKRDQRYRGMKYAVVCEHDTYEVDHSEGNPRVRMLAWGEPDLPLVLHRQASKPVAFEDQVNPARWRGRILGAWAKCYVQGQPPEFYYAPIHEHIRMREKWEGKGDNRRRVLDGNGRPVVEPDGAWGYVSTMILKAAQSYVLRIALGITGVVPLDELVGGQLGAIEGSATPLPEEAEFDWGNLAAPDGLVEELREAVDEVNRLAPLSWSPAKCEMVMLGRSADELDRILGQLRAEAENLAARAAVRGAEESSEGGEGDSSPGPDVPAEALREAQVEPDAGPPEAEVVTEGEDQIARLKAMLRDPSVTEEERTDIQVEIEALETERSAGDAPGQEKLV